ncbi:ribosome small subunit-dependent GTPase A [Williamsia sp. 1135]|uniref:ribosome small subunit-dependent GTPase A n=1 Tax=Williamsia sp. 1135 TaxID=1889262 RepID=UPI001F0A647C|nr:ribosome small subunit-dependent GTPase A [Williamsia sp. 1135]
MLAANVDSVVVTISASIPLKNARIERLLAVAWDSGAKPVVAVTKADLSDDVQAFSADVSAAAVGVDVVVTSATTTEGLDALTSTLDGTAVLIGPSGAGKSTLANALLGEDILATGPVRSADGKGRHTTVHRELRPMPGGGVLIDTPGLRALGVADIGAALENVFRDIDHLAGQCSFRDCTHRTEAGCAVADAVVAGRLAADRLERYRKLKWESDWQAARSNVRAAKERKRRDKAIARDQRAMYRFRDRQR